jgi:ABC-type transport system involved in multi-copper enzyme maturation permease subunit
MLHVVRSELTRLGQRRTMLVWFGLMALFAVMVNTVMATVVGDSAASSLPSPGVSFPTLAELESPAGVMAGLSAASNLLGIVTLSVWATFTAQDYSSGLIRLLVAGEPRRWRLLAGKVVALLGVTALATTVAVVANAMAAPIVGASGMDTSAWGTDVVAVVGEAWANLYLSLAAWGVLGLVIAVLTRSAMAAVAIGVGYVLVVESLIEMIDGAPSDWLLGTTLNAIASGGTSAQSYGTALALGAAYVIVGLVLAGAVFTRRDVTD